MGRPSRGCVKVQTASDVLAEDLHVLLKLHGNAGDTEDRILPRSEYVRLPFSQSGQGELKRRLPQLLGRLFRRGAFCSWRAGRRPSQRPVSTKRGTKRVIPMTNEVS